MFANSGNFGVTLWYRADDRRQLRYDCRAKVSEILGRRRVHADLISRLSEPGRGHDGVPTALGKPALLSVCPYLLSFSINSPT